jgi:hypothetical protein
MNARTDVEHRLKFCSLSNYKIYGDFNAASNVKPCFRLRLIVFTIRLG